MKYETYKKLTDEQKDEWNFKYDKAYRPPNLLQNAVMVWMIIGTTMSVALVTLKGYVELTLPILDLMAWGMTVTSIILIITIVQVATRIYLYCANTIEERNWLKKIGVK